ncbi:hypothetical protein CAEBREN_18840 [Caenorhabditis brenneri]|uniref:MADF domain-containing protein n=1 Tax=Caenorhabditis brenneri TaxID=135651 RepID=G0NDZ7_CAEBE|nr:hypothetical protein CAEBREN_18840 [Caenorhabditis brenneri]
MNRVSGLNDGLPDDGEYNIPIGDPGIMFSGREPPVSPVGDLKLKVDIDVHKYRKMKRNDFNNLEDIAARKNVIGMIKERKNLWAFKKVSVPREKWEEFAVEHFLRTGNFSHDIHIRRVWGSAKKKLLEILTESIQSRDTEEETEEKLEKWELYRSMYFYRAVTYNYEVELRKKVEDLPYDETLVHDLLTFTDVVTSYEDVQGEDGEVHRKPVREPPLILDETDTGTTRKIRAPPRKPGLSMTLREYRALRKEQFAEPRDVENIKLTLSVIEEFPILWECKKAKIRRVEYEWMAIELYLRTEVLLSVEHIRMIFNEAKEKLRKELQICKLRRLSSYETELQLDRWELYHQMKFFKEAMMEFDIDVNKEKVFEDELLPNGDDGALGFFNSAQPQGVNAGEAPEVNMDPHNEDSHLPVDNNPPAPLFPKIPVPDRIDGLTMTLNEYKKFGRIRIPGPKPGVQMTLDEYRAMGIEEFEDRTDAQAKKWVLSLIEKNPALWCRRNMKTAMEQWQELAVEFYLRTGSTMSVSHIRSIWKDMKDSMLKILREPLDSAKVEEELAKWEFYGQMKFFRRIMKEVEDAREKDSVEKPFNVEILYDEKAFDDVFDTTVEDGREMPPEHKRVEAEFEEYHRDEEMVESPRPQDADAELDPITAEAASILGRLLDIGQDGNEFVQNLTTAFIEVVDRPGLEDTSMNEVWNSMKEVLSNRQEAGEENRPA